MLVLSRSTESRVKAGFYIDEVNTLVLLEMEAGASTAKFEWAPKGGVRNEFVLGMGATIQLTDDCILHLLSVGTTMVRVGFDAPRTVAIVRFDAIKRARVEERGDGE